MREKAAAVTTRDTLTKGWRTEYEMTDDQGNITCHGTVRTGEYTTSVDAGILATAEIIHKATATIAITTSTTGPTEALKEATTSLNEADRIRQAVKKGKAKVIHQPDVTLSRTRSVYEGRQPKPRRYTSQAYIQGWMTQRKDKREQKQFEALPDTYKKLGVGPKTKRAVSTRHRELARETIQHRTGHGAFESHHERFDRNGIPTCRADKQVRTTTHYLTCTKGQIGPEPNLALHRFAGKRIRKFAKEARQRKKSLWDVIHAWHMTKGIRRFWEIMEEKKYWEGIRMLTEKDMAELEPPSPAAG